MRCKVHNFYYLHSDGCRCLFGVGKENWPVGEAETLCEFAQRSCILRVLTLNFVSNQILSVDFGIESVLFKLRLTLIVITSESFNEISLRFAVTNFI